MQMRSKSAVAVLALALGLAGPVRAQDLTLQLDATTRTLTLPADATLPAAVVAGKTFTVRVRGVTAEPAWKLKLSGATLGFVSATPAGADFSTSVGANVQPVGGRVTLGVEDPAATNRVTMSPIQMNFRDDTDTGTGNRTGSAATSGCNADQSAQLVQPPRGRDQVTLFFNQDGLPLRPMPTQLDENDAIAILMLLPCAGYEDYSVTLEGTLATGDQNILAAGGLASLAKVRTGLGAVPTSSAAARDTFYMGTYGPFAPTQVTVVIKKKETVLHRYPIRVLKNYIGAFRLGVGQSRIRFNDFQLRAAAGNDTANVVTNVSDDREPRYYVGMVFYAWHFWDNHFWNGRDISEPPSLIDRLNPFVGVGLKDPGREYLAGLTLEVARGVDVVWGVHIARTQQLTNGVKEGDKFRGAQKDIPTRHEWETSSHFFGVSVDLAAGVDVLQGILGK